MPRESRYDKLKTLISNDFSRSRTLTPGLSANEQRTLINLNDHSDTFAIPERFQKFGPFNSVYVQNFSDNDVRVYLNEDRSVFVDVPGTSGIDALAVLQKVPKRYVDYLRIENLSGANSISEGDLQLQVGNEIDSEELTLLEMSGLLNV